MKFRFFSLVYGNQFLDAYERVAVRSMLQTRNKAAIPVDAVVSLYTDQASLERAAAISGRIGTVEATIIPPAANAGEGLNRSLIMEIERCLKDGSTLIMLAPDTYWGDGSLANLISVAADQQICVGASHVRVNQASFLQSLTEADLPNDELVKAAMSMLHKTWLEANADLQYRNTYLSGTVIRKVEPKLYAVQHLLPTIFLARFTPDDLEFFKRQEKMGAWDHTWPSILVDKNRQRIITSSDIFFAAEVTPENQNIPPVSPADPREADKYRGQLRHHAVNRNAILSWRSA